MSTMALNISDLILSVHDTDSEPYERGPSLTFGVFWLLISVTWTLEEPLRRRPSACCRRLPVLGLYQVRMYSKIFHKTAYIYYKDKSNCLISIL